MDDTNQTANFQVTSSAPIAPIEPKKLKLWKKIILGLFIVVVLIGAGLYFLPNILSLLFSGDAVLADNSKLILQKVLVNEADNGFYDLNKITKEMIKVPVNDQKVAFDVEYNDSTKPIQWNQKLVDQVLNQNQQALNLFATAADKGHIQIPDYADPANINLNTPIPLINSWRSVARLQAIKALSLSFQGKPDQALQETVKLNKIGHNLIYGHNGLLGALAGISIQQLGSQTILRILPYNNPSKQSLETTKANIQSSSDNLEGYRDAFRFEYVNVSSAVDKVNSQFETEIQQIMRDGGIKQRYAKFEKYGYYYKPNQTKNLFIELYNSEVAAVGTKCQLQDLEQKLTLTQSQIVDRVSSWKGIFTENVLGKILYAEFGVSLGAALTDECQNNLIANVAQTELALRQYKIDKGQFPNTLSELTPQYLTSVPLDPFDHQPIRYSATKKILYSVGLKNQDLGGSEGIDWTKMDNPTFKLSF